MSTRGCVAIGTSSDWRGIYNHWDSYPTGLGREVWQHLQEILRNGKALDDFTRELLSYDDWRAYLREGICEYCGKRTTQPHSISGVIFSPRLGERFQSKDQIRRHLGSFPAWKGRKAEIEAVIEREWQIRDNLTRTGYPDPKVKHHQHETEPVEALQITSENPDPLFIEWVYLIAPKTVTFHVLVHRGEPKPTCTPLEGEGCRAMGNGHWDYGHCIYWYELLESFPISGPEPDWKGLEDKNRSIGKRE